MKKNTMILLAAGAAAVLWYMNSQSATAATPATGNGNSNGNGNGNQNSNYGGGYLPSPGGAQTGFADPNQYGAAAGAYGNGNGYSY